MDTHPPGEHLHHGAHQVVDHLVHLDKDILGEFPGVLVQKVAVGLVEVLPEEPQAQGVTPVVHKADDRVLHHQLERGSEEDHEEDRAAQGDEKDPVRLKPAQPVQRRPADMRSCGISHTAVSRAPSVASSASMCRLLIRPQPTNAMFICTCL